MANCKDPMEIALRIIREDSRILHALNRGKEESVCKKFVEEGTKLALQNCEKEKVKP